jgi:hypothetical protein
VVCPTSWANRPLHMLSQPCCAPPVVWLAWGLGVLLLQALPFPCCAGEGGACAAPLYALQQVPRGCAALLLWAEPSSWLLARGGWCWPPAPGLSAGLVRRLLASAATAGAVVKHRSQPCCCWLVPLVCLLEQLTTCVEPQGPARP